MKMPVILFILLFAAGIVQAAPLSNDKTKSQAELKKIEQDLKDRQARDAALAQKSATLGRDISSLKQKLVEVSARVQKHEAELDALEQRLLDITGQEAQLAARLQKDQARFGHFVTILLDLARLPPDLLLFAPTPPQTTINTTLVLQGAAQHVKAQVKDAQRNLEKLAALRDDVAAQRATTVAARAQLSDDKNELGGLLSARESARQATDSARAAAQAEAKALADKAADLRDLLAKLKAAEAARPKKGKPAKALVFVPGNAKLPVIGAVTKAYGARDASGSAARGTTISARAGAVVTAPMAGDVAFAGPFRKYGNVVILAVGAHQHILLTGVGEISVATGDHVNSGEPVARMPDSGSATLYIETRDGGEPVDPKGFGLSL